MWVISVPSKVYVLGAWSPGWGYSVVLEPLQCGTWGEGLGPRGPDPQQGLSSFSRGLVTLGRGLLQRPVSGPSQISSLVMKVPAAILTSVIAIHSEVMPPGPHPIGADASALEPPQVSKRTLLLIISCLCQVFYYSNKKLTNPDYLYPLYL